MSLFSLGLLAAYFAGGMQYMMNQEGWDAADAFYFWSRAVWKSTSELAALEFSRHRADAATEKISRRWRGAPEL